MSDRVKVSWSVGLLLAMGAVASLATCAYNPPPIPVGGDRVTLGYLAGEWAGSFYSADADRGGSLFFRLRAGADTAFGDILMTPTREFHDPDELEMPRGLEAPPILNVSFVMAAGDEVYGSLDPYADPDCGCTLDTRFAGRITATGIEGTYTMRHVDSGIMHRGTWSARRVGPPPAAEMPTGLEPGEPGEPEAGEPGVGPTHEEMVAQGERLFRDLGCAFCHGDEAEGAIGPGVAAVTEHRSFSWIFRMILNPDSMVRNDPAAREMYRSYDVRMPDRSATPWEALLLYEYLITRVAPDGPVR